MTEPVSLAPADDTIAAVRVVRGVLDGEAGPWPVPVTAIRGLAILLISVLGATAELQGITGKDFQDDWIRDWLDRAHQNATMLAAEREIKGGDD